MSCIKKCVLLTGGLEVSFSIEKVNTLEGYQHQLEDKLSQTDEKLIDI